MSISTEIWKGEAFLPIADALQLMIAFGSFLVSLIGLVVVLIKHINDKKK